MNIEERVIKIMNNTGYSAMNARFYSLCRASYNVQVFVDSLLENSVLLDVNVIDYNSLNTGVEMYHKEVPLDELKDFINGLSSWAFHKLND
jgi:hypothetical protein